MQSGDQPVSYEQQKASSKCPYEAPDFDCSSLTAIVLAGPTGGGDSGFTGLPDDGPTGEQAEDDYYFG